MKVVSKVRPVALGLPFLCLMLGCSSQAGPAYRGEPLLTIAGRIVIDNPDAPRELVPALAYVTRTTDGVPALEVVDVDVHGDFPASFSLDVFEPPPGDATSAVAAVARLTAVATGHAKGFEMPGENGITSCRPISGEDSGASLVSCSIDFVRCKMGEASQAALSETAGACYHEQRTCDPVDSSQIADLEQHGPCTTVKSWGNPAYEKGIWQNFAGLSKDYLVLYVVSTIPYLDWAVGASQPLEPGYHLVRQTKLPDAEAAERQACASTAYDQAVASYNAEHGTQWNTTGLVPQPDLPARKEIWAQAFANEMAAGCKFVSTGGFEYRVVPSDDAHPVTVELGTDVVPNDFAWFAPFNY